MEPIILIHGYSAEGRGADLESVRKIYGRLPDALRGRYGSDAVIEIDLGRYISLEDGVGVEDISHALQRALGERHPGLLAGGFNAIVHSTGALVVRNWLRRHWRADSGLPCPARRVIHLAGANFGSGWAHVGRTQAAKWLRLVLGTERGLQVLDSLELGSAWTIAMHLELDEQIRRAPAALRPLEFCLIGSQVPPEWFVIPVRYAKEDGADGVVRVAACNLNYNHVRIALNDEGRRLTPEAARKLAARALRPSASGLTRRPAGGEYFEVAAASYAAASPRPVPMAVVHDCAHTGGKRGILGGENCLPQVMELITAALDARADTLGACVERFAAVQRRTLQAVQSGDGGGGWLSQQVNPRAQYDGHSQLILRVFDQLGQPVRHFNAFFNPFGGEARPKLLVSELIEDTHANAVSPNTLVFYLRTRKFDERSGGWQERVPLLGGCDLEIEARQPGTDLITYLPLRLRQDSEQLARWLRPDETTIVDVTLPRVPTEKVLRLWRLP